jgi:hypothetical protein
MRERHAPRSPRGRGPIRLEMLRWCVALCGAAVLSSTGCAGPSGDETAIDLEAPAPGIDPPRPDPITGSPAATTRTEPGEPETVEDIFPATATRGLVLNNCASCHALACAAIGQRSPARWREVEASHATAIPGLSIEDRGRIFDYLMRFFNDTLPEPHVPTEFLEGGCPSL